MCYTLLEMLTYKRPAYSKTLEDFCFKYIQPVFGKPDPQGNYLLVIGDNPEVAFTAHSDTVHNDDGKQVVEFYMGIATSDENCLGADCTTGVWLILQMIQAKVPGVYIIFAKEEIGCLGSNYMSTLFPEELDNVKAMISFDRKGYDEIVTHQMGKRTASDAFAESLNEALGMNMKPSREGVYTDSNEFEYIIPECTNISVGYFNQHTKKEYQNLDFAEDLAEALICADWSQLVFERDPAVEEYDEDDFWWRGEPKSKKTIGYAPENLEEFILANAAEVAMWLEDSGITKQDLEIDIFGTFRETA